MFKWITRLIKWRKTNSTRLPLLVHSRRAKSQKASSRQAQASIRKFKLLVGRSIQTMDEILMIINNTSWWEMIWANLVLTPVDMASQITIQKMQMRRSSSTHLWKANKLRTILRQQIISTINLLINTKKSRLWMRVHPCIAMQQAC